MVPRQELAEAIINGAHMEVVLVKAYAVLVQHNHRDVVMEELSQELAVAIINGVVGEAVQDKVAVQAQLKAAAIVGLKHANQIISGALVQAKAHAVQARQILKVAVMEVHNHVHVHHHVHGAVLVLVREVENAHLVQQVQQVVEQMLDNVMLEVNQELAAVITNGDHMEVVVALMLAHQVKFATE